MKEARGGGRPNGRLIPAVEYLQSQRVRMMMMMKLAEATANVDVYVVARTNTERRRRPRPGERTTARARRRRAAGEPTRPQTPTQRHFAMANLACYPAINVPNGFIETGSPTNVTFFARPFGEMEVARAREGVSGRGRAPPEAPGRGDRVIE